MILTLKISSSVYTEELLIILEISVSVYAVNEEELKLAFKIMVPYIPSIKKSCNFLSKSFVPYTPPIKTIGLILTLEISSSVYTGK